MVTLGPLPPLPLKSNLHLYGPLLHRKFLKGQVLKNEEWGGVKCIIFLGPQSTSCPFRTASHARSVATTRPWAPSVFLMADFLLLLPVGEDTWAVSCLFPSYPNLVSAWSVL